MPWARKDPWLRLAKVLQRIHNPARCRRLAVSCQPFGGVWNSFLLNIIILALTFGAAAGEVILFTIPTAESCLLISRLNKKTTEEELLQTLSQHGLIYDLRLYEVDDDKPCAWPSPSNKYLQSYSLLLTDNYAFVRFYSSWAAHNVFTKLKYHKFYGTTCRVSVVNLLFSPSLVV